MPYVVHDGELLGFPRRSPTQVRAETVRPCTTRLGGACAERQ